MPAKIDTELSLKIHQSFIELLDEDKMVFTSENILELDLLAANLAQNILDLDSTYFTKTIEIYLGNLKNAETISTRLFARKETFDPQKKLIINNDSIFVSQNDFEKNWEYSIQNSIIYGLIGKLKESTFIYSNDSLPLFFKASKKTTEQAFKDYFKNMFSNDNYFTDLYLNAITNAFDPHSNYFNSEMNQQFSQELTSERELFGISYSKNLKQEIEITQITPGSSAWMSGAIHTGDVIISLKFGDNPEVSTAGLTNYEVSALFNSNSSKLLKLSLRDEDGAMNEVNLEKSIVYSDEDIIKAALLSGEKNIGYIALPDFYMNWTDTTSLGCANDVAKALIKLKKESFDGLILDLRDNGGGSLREAIDLVGIFIDYGPVLVEKTYNDDINTLKDFNRGAIYSGPLMILINENSASASEVVAGAIQDYNRGLIVGQRSFGKATGQIVMPVDPLANTIVGEINGPNEDWGYLKITDIGLYRIDLSTNQKNGVQPDVELLVPYIADDFREEDYPTVLELDPITKKMYFTPQVKINTSDLSAKSLTRQTQDNAFIQRKELFLKTDSLEAELSNQQNSIASIIKLEKALFLEIEKLKEMRQKTTIFAPKSLNYDQGLYTVNSYLKTYQEDFFESILMDRELKEAYQIMNDFIKQ